jgi:hypothetical protein
LRAGRSAILAPANRAAADERQGKRTQQAGDQTRKKIFKHLPLSVIKRLQRSPNRVLHARIQDKGVLMKSLAKVTKF